MSSDEFKARATNLGREDFDGIDELCFSWLRDSANEQAPKVRAMMLAALDVLRRGME